MKANPEIMSVRFIQSVLPFQSNGKYKVVKKRTGREMEKEGEKEKEKERNILRGNIDFNIR